MVTQSSGASGSPVPLPAAVCWQPCSETFCAAAHAQAAGKDAIGREAARDTVLHDLPDAEDVAAHGFPASGVSWRRALIAHHHLVDAQVIALAISNSSAALEKGRAGRGGHQRWCVYVSAVFDDESAADGKIGRAEERLPVTSNAVKRMPLGCCVRAPGGIIWSRWKRISADRGREWCGGRAARASTRVGCFEFSVDGVGIERGRLFAEQAKHDGAIGGVARAGECERAVEFGMDFDRGGEEPRASSSRRKVRAARMGPMVCELEGPIPTL